MGNICRNLGGRKREGLGFSEFQVHVGWLKVPSKCHRLFYSATALDSIMLSLLCPLGLELVVATNTNYSLKCFSQTAPTLL